MDLAERDELASLVDLAGRVQEIMLARNLTLATAESCTGGLIAYVLTEISGSSDYFVGGIVSYSNVLKERELGVAASTLAEFGAVSEQTCAEMAEGARRRYGADFGVSATGIAGPGGGSESKPVGLTYVGVADEHGHAVRRFAWAGDRHTNKVLSTEAALMLVLDRL
ncbi:MAG TPA: CinA family protein [Candidatus Limnocylindrales bacterium]|jgi:nicotinamide-nucleotide amidase